MPALAALPLTDDLTVGTVFRSQKGEDEGTWTVVGAIAFATEEARQKAKRRLSDGLARVSVADVTHDFSRWRG